MNPPSAPGPGRAYAPTSPVERTAAAQRAGGEIAGRSGACATTSTLAMLLALTAVSVTILALSTRGITSEGTVSLQGDMPRYLMNGVYFHDLVRDLPFTDVMAYTYRYYARYPALSLGHHPLLLGIIEAPYFAVFGVSVFAARLAVISLLLGGLLAWFSLVQSIYDSRVALFSTLLLATLPYLVDYSRVVMSEAPTVSMILIAAYLFQRYCLTARTRHALAFAVVFSLSAYGKHLAVFMLPIFAVYLAIQRGWRCLLTRDVLLAGAIIAVLLTPLVVLSLDVARASVVWIAGTTMTERVAANNLAYYPTALWQHQLTAPLSIAVGVSAILSLYRRDRRVLLFALWICGFYLQLTYIGAQDHRYAIYWLPPFTLLPAASLALFHNRWWRTSAAVVLSLIVAYDFAVAWQDTPTYAEGYEEAARYVVAHPKGETVLFSGNVDSGYFVFFVRKHDPNRRLIVLRADKVIATSSLSRIIEDRVTTPVEILDALRKFGTGYVVIEDAPYASHALELLREQLRGGDFILRERIPLRSSSPRLQDVDLAIYEYLGYTPARREAILNMRIPLMDGSVTLQMRDLLDH